MVMPYIDEAQARRAAALAALRAIGATGESGDSVLVAVYDAQRLGFVQVINQVFEHAQSAWFGYMAQDAFAGRNWLPLALQALKAQNGALLAFNDGKWQGELAAFGLAQAAWARSVYGGSFFFPGYHSHFADVELTLIAKQQGRFVYEPNSLLVEMDWHKDQTGIHPPDRALYRTRVRQKIGGRVSDESLLSRFS